MAHYPRAAVRSGTATPASGSQTLLVTGEPGAGPSVPVATLHLRAEREPAPHVRWAEDVLDNEGMGKKSSKVCCIYHKPHEPDDSDSESDSSSSSDSSSDDDRDGNSDSEPDLSRAQRAGGSSGGGRGKKGGHRGAPRRHDHDGEGGGEGSGKGKGKARKPSPNAYERQPKHASKKDG